MSKSPRFNTAIKWAFVMSWGPNAIATLLTFVLAGILGPRDYGLVAMAAIYIAFVQIFLEGGLGAAVVQRQNLEPEHLDAVFLITVTFSLLLTGLTYVIAPFWAAANDQPDLTNVMRVLSLALPLQGLTVVQESMLERKLDFKSLAIRSNVSTLVSGAVSLVLALNGFKVWALVYGNVVGACCRVILLWGLGTWRPSLRFSFRHVKELFGFSAWVMMGQIGTFVQRRSDALLIGLFFGPAGVGIYRLADQAINTVIELATRPFVLVVLPHFAKMQDNIPELRKSVFKCLRTSAMLTMPLLGMLVGLAYLICAALTRPDRNWTDAEHVIQILALIGAARAVTLFTGPLMQAIGRPRTSTMMSWSLAVFNTAAFCATGFLFLHWVIEDIQLQAMGMAASRATVFVLVYTPICLYLMTRITDMRWSEIGRSLMPALITAAAIAVVGIGIDHVLRATTSHWQGLVPNLVRLGIAGAITAGLAVLMMYRLDDGVRQFVNRRLNRVRAVADGTNGSADAGRSTTPEQIAAANAQAAAIANSGTADSDLPKSAIESRTST